MGRRFFLSILVFAFFAVTAVVLGTTGRLTPSAEAALATGNERVVYADVVALDQVIIYNRLGAANPNGLIYALKNDVVTKTAVAGLNAGDSLRDVDLTAAGVADALKGNVMLRPDKRPRPIVLRANVGDIIQINFTNLLDPTLAGVPAPNSWDPANHEEWPADRHVGIHVNNMQLVDSSSDDGSFVGQNASSVLPPGQNTTYRLYAEYENTFLMYNLGAAVGSEGSGGTTGLGLFGAINVEPISTEWYRSQLTRLEMDMAASTNGDNTPDWDPVAVDPTTGQATGYWTVATTGGGQPIINYDAVYPNPAGLPPHMQDLLADKVGLPIVAMLAPTNQLVHSDLNAVITGPGRGKILTKAYAPGYWKNENYPGGDDPFREFTVIFHDEAFAVQAFPQFTDPALSHTLHGVQDAFPINYGSGGIGAEIIANRLGLGPSTNCVECKYEEFFLTSSTVGDPAMIVDVPASANVNPDGSVKATVTAATKAFFPDDPANVHHSYLNDRVKFRQLHAGPKEHHIFHLHAHQWQFDWNEQGSSYLDSQGIGPGSGFTYEIAYGGSGNRNKTVGDSIFHCHFYPHFAMGMWELWRVHDVFERGTALDGAGRPAAGSRALPDGEILAGTPIPGVVPLPSIPMAPAPAVQATLVTLADPDGDGPAIATSQIDLDRDGTADILEETIGEGDGVVTISGNPGYPFFIPVMTGHRPPTPALDIVDVNGDGTLDDGGLPRHIINTPPGTLNGHATHAQYQTPVDFNKILESAGYGVLPEDGTAAEKAAMDFHAARWHETYLPNGQLVDNNAGNGGVNLTRRLAEAGNVGPTADDPNMPLWGFETNGLAPAAGAPYADPCRTDPKWGSGAIARVDKTRRYKGANIEMDITLNKVGWHFQQQRFETLWEDVAPTLSGQRAPEPLVMRLNPTECAEFWHTNLVPNVYELDDYQVRTPTDIIGQHIHLVKFDVLSADGSANGWNYEDGTLSPQEVVERIHAIHTANGCESGVDGFVDTGAHGLADAAGDTATDACPLAVQHPYFGPELAGTGAEDLTWGARTTVQRWYADPLLTQSWDEGLGTVFTHDHYGPSTHQQVGLYSTVLIEPLASKWRDPETGQMMGSILGSDDRLYLAGNAVSHSENNVSLPRLTASNTLAPRQDGGPTSWRADILTPNPENSHREFYFEFADFQHAYHAGAAVNPVMVNNGAGVPIPSYADFYNSVNPSFRQQPPNGFLEDLFFFPEACPGLPDARFPGLNGRGTRGGACPEAISADDPGTYVVNYRNEPLALRVFDPATGTQTQGAAGDLAQAFASLTNRAIPQLNTAMGLIPGPWALSKDIKPGDPATPMMRVYAGDTVRIRVQTGAHEEEHNFTIDGLKWRQEPFNPDSGWRNSQFMGISEQFILDMPVIPGSDPNQPIDYVYKMGAQVEDTWNGVWGLLRSYSREQNNLLPLPNNNMLSRGIKISNADQFKNGVLSACPLNAPERQYNVVAVQAVDVLGPEGLVYNDRATTLTALPGSISGTGPLVDPTALMYVLKEDIGPDGLLTRDPEPLVLRANAGDCIIVILENRLPLEGVTDMPGYSALPPIVQKEQINGATALQTGFVTFNANDLVPSNNVGLHPQLVAYDVLRQNGYDAGQNGLSNSHLVAPGTQEKFAWYAGDLSLEKNKKNNGSWDGSYTIKATPIEFGVANLTPADPIKGSNKGLVGALVIEPLGATWTEDPGTRTSATVYHTWGATPSAFREFVTVLQNDVNLRYAGGNCSGNMAGMECAVRNIAAEEGGVPEDPQDSGQKAINYGSDPLWYRLGIAPDTPFSHPNLRDSLDNHRVFANELVGGDPQTPVFVVSPVFTDVNGDGVSEAHYVDRDTTPDALQFRQRVVQPGGHARGTVFDVNAHAWQREPYVADSSRIGDDFRTHNSLDLAHGSHNAQAHNMTSWWVGSQEGVGPSSHFDLVPRKTGGNFGIEGDYLFSDYASAGRYQGLWGIIRFNVTPPMAANDGYGVREGETLTIAAPGVLGNDRDLDGHAMTAELVAAPTEAVAFTLNPDGSFEYVAPLGGFIGKDSFTYQASDENGLSDVVTVVVTVRENMPPVANDDLAQAIVDTPEIIDVLANDDDADGDPLTIVSWTQPTAQNASLQTGLVSCTDTDCTYTPPAGYTGEDTFTYTIDDAHGGQDSATVTVKVSDILVTLAEYNDASRRWRINGIGQAGATIDAYNGTCDPAAEAAPACSTLTKIGSSTADAVGAWSISRRGTAPTDGKVTLVSSTGTSTTVEVAIK